MPDKHAVLSASSSHRWLACPPSALLCAKEKDKPSEFAMQGTDAHTLCEHKLKTALGQQSKDPVEDLTFFDEEMADCTDMYAQYVMEQLSAAKERCNDPIVLIEQHLDFSQWVPDGFGTGDCVIVADETLTVIDFKYGVGILVDAENNPQMMCYALGALSIFDGIYDIKEITMTIFQPRREHVSTFTISKEALLSWAEETLAPTAQLASKGEGEYKAGSHCQFCKVKAICRKRAEYNLELACYDFEMPESLEDDEIEVILRVARNTWSDEIEKWDHLHNLTFAIAVGSEKERLEALRKQADITMINRENLQWLIEKSGQPFEYDMVVIDELSSFKNHQAKRFKALMKERHKVKRIVGLTGTPSSNGLMDLFAEFKILDMGVRLGRFIGQYRNTYFKPDKVNGPIVYSYKPLPGAEDAIYEKISDITISMKAADHLKMPELVNTKYMVHLSEKEKKKYEDMKAELVLELPEGEITAANAASLSGKLSQMANGAVYADDESILPIHDRKLDALEDIIESANGKPLLIAYWFKHDLIRIEQRLAEKKIPFQKLDSDASMKKWNRGELPVALIHPASAGHGLNLQSGGSTLVWFGITWSLELYQQTVARLYRQGQSSRTVTVIHILTQGTVDEKIMKALAEKDSTQSALIDAVKAEL